MLVIDKYLTRRFDIARYNCWHLVQEAWLEHTGVQLGFPGLEEYAPDVCAELVPGWQANLFREVAPRTDPSIVLFQRARTVPHVGVFCRGRVLHIKRSGAKHQPVEVAGLGFTSTAYYLPTCL